MVGTNPSGRFEAALVTGELGNDIIDLTLPEAIGKANDLRFVQRVCQDSEQRWLYAQPDPTRALWQLFAAKEATYKAAKKRWPQSSLSFWQLSVSVENGRCQVNGQSASLLFDEAPDHVHCIAWLRQQGEKPAQLFCQVIRASSVAPFSQQAGQLSQRLRQLTKDSLCTRGLDSVEIHKDQGAERWRPPRAYRHGRLLREVELSFSHDGPLGAVVVARSAKEP